MLDIQNMLINGRTLPEIAKIVDIDYQYLVYLYKPVKKHFKYFGNNIETPKEASEMKNLGAVSFAFDGVYKWENLCENEIEAYNNYNKKNKAYYESL